MAPFRHLLTPGGRKPSRAQTLRPLWPLKALDSVRCVWSLFLSFSLVRFEVWKQSFNGRFLLLLNSRLGELTLAERP